MDENLKAPEFDDNQPSFAKHDRVFVQPNPNPMRTFQGACVRSILGYQSDNPGWINHEYLKNGVSGRFRT